MTALPPKRFFRVTNTTRKRLLHPRARCASRIWEHALGFMFQKPGPEDCIVFSFARPRAVSMHMFFVFGPIDIIVLDDGGRVLALKERFAPWTLWNPDARSALVVELPAGAIARTGTAVGDAIVLRNTSSSATIL